MQIEHVSVESLIPYARNSRTHSDEQVAQIAASIKEFGWTNPILVDGENGIIAGHGRLLAARKLKMSQVPVIQLDGMTDTQKKAYIIADNKLALNAGWDDELLGLELGELDLEGFDLQLTGFTQEEIDALNPKQISEGLTDEDAVPEPPVDPVTRFGDVWLLGKHRLMCGDSTSIDAVDTLMDGEKANFCFTSPPYNAAIKSAQMHSKAPKAGAGGLYVGGYSDDRTSEEYIDFNRQIFAVMAAIAADGFSCCYNINYNKNSPSEFLDVAIVGREYFKLVETIGWEKAMAVSLQGNNLTRIFEFIFVYAKDELLMNKEQTDCEKNLWRVSNIGANHAIHKAAFPVELVKRGINLFGSKNGIVFDPFGGSGTTLIASEETGRKSRLMELDEKYCDVIVNRWQDFTGKQATLEATGQTFDDIAKDKSLAIETENADG